jgi:nitrite reductase/ring-hydroxylating ferredoxin subunit
MREAPMSCDPETATRCAGCAHVERREFLKDGALILAGIVASLGGLPGRAAALGVRVAGPLARSGQAVTYPIPAADGAQIDHQNDVILVRYQQKVYAFNLSCPHQNTALHWQPEDGQFQCPKHHSRYRPDGVFVSGRATRGMDRFGLRRDGANVVVDLSAYFRQDRDAAQWEAAVIAV